MKNVLVILSMLAITPAALAEKSLDLSCSIIRGGGSYPIEKVIKSGMLENLECPKFFCLDKYEIILNYNGGGYEDVIVKIENKVTGEMANTIHQNLKEGSNFNLGMGNLKTKDGLGIDCEVSKVNN